MSVEHPVVTNRVKAEYFKSNRGVHLKLVDPFHFTYRYNKLIGDKTHYSCTEKARGCSSTAQVKEDFILVTTPHNHCSDLIQLQVQKIRAELKEKVYSEPTAMTSKYVTDWASLSSEPALITQAALLPAMSNRINIWKRAKLEKPAVPMDLEDAGLDLENVPEKYRLTRDGSPFLRYSGFETETRRFMIFMSPEGAKLMRRATDWSLDGTFRTCPSPFMQTYTVVASIKNFGYAAGYIFLPDKRRLTYAAAFRQLRIILEEEGGPLEHFPDRIISDFEQAVPKTVMQVFPEVKEMSLCHVHMCRSLLKNLGQHKILTWFYKSESFHALVKSLAALAFYPAQLIPEKYSEIVEENLARVSEDIRASIKEDQPAGQDEDIEDLYQDFCRGRDAFFDYFESSYVGKKNRCHTYSKPLFSPSLWSQHNAAVQGEVTNSNRNEGLHSVLAKTVNENATIWTVILALQDLEVRTRKRYSDNLSQFAGDPLDGAGEPKDGLGKRKSLTLKRAARLQNEVMNHDKHSTGDFLSRILGFFQMDATQKSD